MRAAGEFVDEEDGAGGGALEVDETKAAWDCTLGEEALAPAEDDGKLPDADGVDEIVPEEGLDEVPAAVDLDLAAFFGLELRDCLRDVALEEGGVVPGDLCESARRRRILGGR